MTQKLWGCSIIPKLPQYLFAIGGVISYTFGFRGIISQEAKPGAK